MGDVRQVLADAQSAELRGDKGEAISHLRRAAEIYRDSGNATRALKMLRHIRRLEGLVDEDEGVPVSGSEAGWPQGASEPHEGAVLAYRLAEVSASKVFEERGPSLAPPELEAWCSFCCRPTREVGPLVAAPTGTFICASCTGIARVLLGDSAVSDALRASAGSARVAVGDGATPSTKPGDRAGAVGLWVGQGVPGAVSEPLQSGGRVLAALPHQQAAWNRITRAGSRLALLIGPRGSGRTTLLAAAAGPGVAVVDLDAPLQSLPVAKRVVLAVPAEAPPPPVVIAGQGVYDTATLVAACAGLVPEDLLAMVDAVGVLTAFDAVALGALAAQLGVTEGVESLVALALKAPRPAQELRALIARLA